MLIRNYLLGKLHIKSSEGIHSVHTGDCLDTEQLSVTAREVTRELGVKDGREICFVGIFYNCTLSL